MRTHCRRSLASPPWQVRKLLFCSGRLYFDLVAARAARHARAARCAWSRLARPPHAAITRTTPARALPRYRYYQANLPTKLTRVYVFSDGCRSQYKGKKNFVRIAQFPSRMHGIRLVHRFAASHHFKGPHDAYGKDAKHLRVGMPIRAQGSDGQTVMLWIVEDRGSRVALDGNHPLAGKTLHFHVEIVSLRAATAEELAHGHVHGPGGHHH